MFSLLVFLVNLKSLLNCNGWDQTNITPPVRRGDNRFNQTDQFTPNLPIIIAFLAPWLVGWKVYWVISFIKNYGVDTFVQGTVVQGDYGPRGQMSKGQLSKEIYVRGDFCPRKLLPVISLLKLFFFLLYWMLRYWLIIKWQKNNMNNP